MATLLNADLPSEEEDDVDYNAATDKTAEAEDRREFVGDGGGATGRKRQRRLPKFIEEDEKAAAEHQGQQGQQQQQEEEPDELAADDEDDPRVRAKKAKIGHLWDLLNAKDASGAPQQQKQPSKAAAPASAPGAAAPPPASSSKPSLATSSLASLCKPAKPAKARNPDELWMRSLGLLPKSSQAPKKDKDTSQPQPSPAAAAPSTQQQQQQQQQQGEKASSAAEPSPAPEAQNQEQQQQHQAGTSSDATGAQGFKKAQSPVDEGARAAAAAALAAVRGGPRLHNNKVEVTETRRFAGKDIQVTLQVEKDSKEAKKAAERAAKPPPQSGLDAFLAEVEKKKKVNVLDKSKADWQQMKGKDATLEEELEAHRRSGGQFLDKQDFLKRAELREYEKERDTRLASDVLNRGRL